MDISLIYIHTSYVIIQIEKGIKFSLPKQIASASLKCGVFLVFFFFFVV